MHHSFYRPIQDGIDKRVRSVRYVVKPPPAHLSGVVHAYWELKTQATLPEDFLLLAVPDACVNLLFNQLDPAIAGVTALRARHEVLNLGRAFHYVGIELFPGVWRGSPKELHHQFVGAPYAGDLPLLATSKAMAALDFTEKQGLMSLLVERLIEAKLIAPNPLTANILHNLKRIRSVSDMARLAGLSPRQLQRNLRQSTGLAPHDLLKVLRMQRSFHESYLDLYADQAHYIHAFRALMGYTPLRFFDRFDVRSLQDSCETRS